MPRYASNRVLKPYFPRKFRVNKRYRNLYAGATLAYAAYKGVKKLKKLINVEHKKFDASYNAGVSTAQNTPILDLGAIAQGDGQSDRQGNSIKCEKFTMSGQIYVDQSATTSASSVRLVLVKDNQQVADSDPVWQSLFESTSPFSLINKNTVGRFSILFDRTYQVSKVQGKPSALIKATVPLNFHMRWNGAASTDHQKNGLYLFAISNESTYQPIVEVYGRMTFIDN